MGKKQKESFHKSKLKEQRILRLKSIKKEKQRQLNNSEFYKIYTHKRDKHLRKTK